MITQQYETAHQPVHPQDFRLWANVDRSNCPHQSPSLRARRIEIQLRRVSPSLAVGFGRVSRTTV